MRKCRIWNRTRGVKMVVGIKFTITYRTTQFIAINMKKTSRLHKSDRLTRSLAPRHRMPPPPLPARTPPLSPLINIRRGIEREVWFVLLGCVNRGPLILGLPLLHRLPFETKSNSVKSFSSYSIVAITMHT